MPFLLAFTVGFVLTLPIQAEIEAEADLYGTEGALLLRAAGLTQRDSMACPLAGLDAETTKKQY